MADGLRVYAKGSRRCQHPRCDEPEIPRGETYEIVDGVAYHLECALVVKFEEEVGHGSD